MNPFSSRRHYLPGVTDELFSPRYDYQIVDAVQAFTEFFSVPVGIPVRGGVKTTRDTNMYRPNVLPEENHFLVTAIRVLFVPDALSHRGRKAEDEQDANRMLLGGELRFQIQNRDYVQDGPLAKFPTCLPRTWMGELAYLTPDAEEAHWRAVYDPTLQRIANLHAYKITPLYIQPNQFFRVQICAEPQPLNAPGKLGVILDGHLIRQAR